MRGALCFLVCALWAGAVLAANSSASLAAQQAEAKKQQTELRARIETLQKEIDRQESSRRDAANDLKASESAISSINRRLADLAAQKRHAEHDLAEIGDQITVQKRQMAQRQNELADQLRAQYASGLSPWTALLSGDDPQAIGRDLSYLGYISEAQADSVRAIRAAIKDLAALQAKSEARRKELGELALETAEQKKALEQQQQDRQKVLARIESLLQKQRAQAAHMQRNDEHLGELISGLQTAIARQAEQARQAEEKRKAEAARKAEQARKAALEQRREIERRRAEARQAEQQAQAAQVRARRAQDEQAAEQARLQVEQARDQSRKAEQAARAADLAKAKSAKEEASSASSPKVAAGSFTGLKKGLPYPVNGEMQGMFGAQRPDGGRWRGIVLRAPEGTAVRAIAPGRVVYANWLSGFGNIMIIDHGANYLSVYGYNQSLLKRVGDIVAAGETIATVGATGGQVESGLYFEIRHQGLPVNPSLWLGH